MALSLSQLRKYIPIKTILGAGAVVGAVTIGGKTLMSGYADARERTAAADVTKIGAQVAAEKQDVQNALYRNAISREEYVRSPAIYDFEHITGTGKLPSGQTSLSGWIVLAIVIVIGAYFIGGLRK